MVLELAGENVKSPQIFGLALTRHAVHHNQGSISDTESSSHFRGEVNVPWGIDQVDQETRAILGLLNEGGVIFTQLVVQGDSSAS